VTLLSFASGIEIFCDPIDSHISIWLYNQMEMEMKNSSEVLSRAFLALGDPTRRAILSRLADGPATVSQLMQPFALSQPAISKHLKVLEQAGLIEGGRDAQRRPRRLRAVALKEAAEWIEHFRQNWERRLDNLDRHLATPKPQEK
jgi:DNA-binding transcriptional ArsR family regulator